MNCDICGKKGKTTYIKELEINVCGSCLEDKDAQFNAELKDRYLESEADVLRG